MLEVWDNVETIFLLTAPPSSTLRFPVKVLTDPGVVQIIITGGYHWLRRKVIVFQKSV